MSAPLVMLHLGLGFFHRAHQAVYLHQLIESGDRGWVLAGGNTRPDMVELIASLAAQGGEYTLETVTPGGKRSYTRITAIKTVVPYDPNLAGLIAIGADASTRVISFTVTEAGYYLDARNRLDLSFPDLATEVRDGAVRLEREKGHELVARLIEALPGRVDSVTVARPTLEDVFLHRTGRRLYGEEAA